MDSIADYDQHTEDSDDSDVDLDGRVRISNSDQTGLSAFDYAEELEKTFVSNACSLMGEADSFQEVMKYQEKKERKRRK